ncbi:MAG: glycosyltransferase family 25 protein, partial [Candidatus Aminicenantes bacterium]|nr:glycosyltransferase family 25 protein [Candidatus Aminicenantes bacterium]
MSLLENIYVINLKRRPERWKRALRQLTACGIDANGIRRVEAVDGQELFKNDRPFLKSILTDTAYREIQERKRSYHEQLTLGAVGCALSHISVWREVVTKGIPESLVFEDDILLSRNFKTLLLQRWPMFPGDRDLVFLGCWHRRKPVAVNRYVVEPVKIFRTHAYALSRQGAEILLKYVFPLRVQLDAYMSAMFSSLRAYALRPK